MELAGGVTKILENSQALDFANSHGQMIGLLCVPLCSLHTHAAAPAGLDDTGVSEPRRGNMPCVW